jgi:hypothetical protein
MRIQLSGHQISFREKFKDSYPCVISSSKDEEENMAEILRIEDFIALAKEGKDVKAEINLRKELISQKLHPGDSEEMKGELDMYLLLADYLFSVGNWRKRVSKIYVYGSSEESLNDAKINKSIANERLKMDYKRLQDVKISFEEKYF